MIDEPLSFKAEKRIVPFNHGRSKSLPFIPDKYLKNYKNLEENYENIQKDNTILEEMAMEKKEEEIIINETESHKLEKSLVPFHESEYHDRTLPSPTYPPLKNNDKEYMTLSTKKRRNNMNRNTNKEKWIEEEDYLKEITRNQLRKFSKHHNKEEKTEELLDSIKEITNGKLSMSKLQTIWNIIKRQSNIENFFSELYQTFISNIKNEKYSNQSEMMNNKFNKKGSVKAKNNNQKSYSSSFPIRHKYRNSKIYFMHPHQLNKKKDKNRIDNRKKNNYYRNRNRNRNNRNTRYNYNYNYNIDDKNNDRNYFEIHGKTIEANKEDHHHHNNNNNQITNYSPLLPTSSSSSLLSLSSLSTFTSSTIKKEEKIIKILKQKFILLNIILFLLKSFMLYHILYPHTLIFIIFLFLIIYKTELLRLNVFTVIRYSVADFVFLYLLKLIYKG